MGLSPAQAMAARAGGQMGPLLKLLNSLSDEEMLELLWDQRFWLRPEQVAPPGDWGIWAFVGGRGTGKSFAGGNFCNEMAKTRLPGVLVGATAKDVRDTMILGPSGVLATAPPWFKPKYEPSKARLTWPNPSSGRFERVPWCFATCYSADKPDRLRGPNAGWGWADEMTSWAHEMAAYDQMDLVLRIGKRPRLCITTTPKPFKKFADLLAKKGTVLTRGTTFDNAANLSADKLEQFREWVKTRFGRQELMGELLMDVEGAIFGRAKWVRLDQRPEYTRRIVAVDPSPTSDQKSDETGIILEGLRYVNDKKRVGILGDFSMRGTPREWASAAISVYLENGCDTLVVEVNSGGEMVEEVVRTVATEMGVTVNVKAVRATSAKSGRGQPVSALAELGQIELVGEFPALMKQLATFTGVNGRRDDRADAMCWGVHELALGEEFFAFF